MDSGSAGRSLISDWIGIYRCQLGPTHGWHAENHRTLAHVSEEFGEVVAEGGTVARAKCEISLSCDMASQRQGYADASILAKACKGEAGEGGADNSGVVEDQNVIEGQDVVGLNEESIRGAEAVTGPRAQA